jgi:hypothetical protein
LVVLPVLSSAFSVTLNRSRPWPQRGSDQDSPFDDNAFDPMPVPPDLQTAALRAGKRIVHRLAAKQGLQHPGGKFAAAFRQGLFNDFQWPPFLAEEAGGAIDVDAQPNGRIRYTVDVKGSGFLSVTFFMSLLQLLGSPPGKKARPLWVVRHKG